MQNACLANGHIRILDKVIPSKEGIQVSQWTPGSTLGGV